MKQGSKKIITKVLVGATLVTIASVIYLQSISSSVISSHVIPTKPKSLISGYISDLSFKQLILKNTTTEKHWQLQYGDTTTVRYWDESEKTFKQGSSKNLARDQFITIDIVSLQDENYILALTIIKDQ